MQSESTSVACCITDQQRIILSVDDAYTDLVQRPRSELLGRDCLSFTAEHDLRRNDKLLRNLQEGGKPFAISKRYVRPNRSTIAVINHVSLFGDGCGPTRLIATCALAPAREHATEPSRARITAQQLRRVLEKGKQAFGGDLINAPAAEILLLLYLAEVEGRVITASEIANATGVSPAMGQRWLTLLIKRGHVEFEEEPPTSYAEGVRIGTAAFYAIDTLVARD